MTALNMMITDAGFDAIVDAQNGGTDAVTIASMGVTSTPFVMAPTLTALPGQIKALDSVSGETAAPNMVHVTARDSSTDNYDITGFGLFLADGTLLAVYSADAPFLSKTDSATALIAADITLQNDQAAVINFGDANFSYPPASEILQGVAEIADNAEVDEGVDDLRIMTPAKTLRAIAGTRPLASAVEADDADNATHSMTPEQTQRLIREALPQGFIGMWSGALVPLGWALCDGTNGTPDLTGQFIIGAGDTYNVGDSGGSASHAHGGAVANHVLTENQMPSHRHQTAKNVEGDGVLTAANSVSFKSRTEENQEYSFNSDGTDGANIGLSSATGGGEAHNHGLSIETADHLPPYFALAYIMKI